MLTYILGPVGSPCAKVWLKSQLASGLIRAIKPSLIWKRTKESGLLKVIIPVLQHVNLHFGDRSRLRARKYD